MKVGERLFGVVVGSIAGIVAYAAIAVLAGHYLSAESYPTAKGIGSALFLGFTIWGWFGGARAIYALDLWRRYDIPRPPGRELSIGRLFRFDLLNTPSKRMFWIIFLIGACISTIGLLRLTYFRGFDDWYSFQEWIKMLFVRDFSRTSLEWASLSFRLGLIALIVGLLGSYLYDQTAGKLVQWLRTGR